MKLHHVKLIKSLEETRSKLQIRWRKKIINWLSFWFHLKFNHILHYFFYALLLASLFCWGGCLLFHICISWFSLSTKVSSFSREKKIYILFLIIWYNNFAFSVYFLCFQKCRLREEPLTFGALCVLKHLLPRFLPFLFLVIIIRNYLV